MNNEEIIDFLENNDESNIDYFLSIIIDKLKDISRESNKLGVMMIVAILLYYLIENSIAKSLSIGPISIGNLKSITVFIPLFFSFLILRFIVISSHKADLLRVSKEITNRKFNIKNSNIEPLLMDNFSRILLPFSLYEEINKLNHKGRSAIGCFGAIIIIPMSIMIALTPYFFVLFWVKDLIINFKSFNLHEKAAIIITSWVIIFSIYYLIHASFPNKAKNGG